MRLRWAVGSAPLMAHHPTWASKSSTTGGVKTPSRRTCRFSSSGRQSWSWASRHCQSRFWSPGDNCWANTSRPLVAFWLEASPHYRLRAHSVQLHSEKRTIGELDFLVEDVHRGRTLHIEVASKFYLAAEDGSAWPNWIGPSGRHDTLAGKMNKLVDQLAASKLPPAREFMRTHRIATPEPVLLMKGLVLPPPHASPPSPFTPVGPSAIRSGMVVQAP